MAYLKGIVMQQLRKVTWANSDPVAIGQIALKLSADSASIEEVRIGTVGGTWETAEIIPTKDYVDSIVEEVSNSIPQVGNGKITVKYNQKEASFTVNQDTATEIDLSELASRDFVTTTLDEYVKAQYLSDNYYTKTASDNKFLAKTDASDTYATKQALNAEAEARQAEDERLAGLISGEATARSEADTALGKRIDGVSGEVAAEKQRAEGAEAGLGTRIKAIEDLDLANNYATKAYADQAEADAKKYTDDKLVDYMTVTAAGNESTRLAGLVTAEAETREAADNALSGRVSTLEGKVKDVTNVMDFVGAGTAFPTTKQKGDVFLRTDEGKEYVYDGSQWVEFGYGHALEAAVGQLQDDVADHEASINAIEPKVGGWDATKSTVDANQAKWNKADSALQPEDIVELQNTVDQHTTKFDDYVLGSTYTADKAKFALKTEVEAAVQAEAKDRADADVVVLGEAQEYATEAIATHNESATAHADIRNAISELREDLNQVGEGSDKKVGSVSAGNGISVTGTATAPVVNLAEVADDSTLEFQFSVFKVDKYGRVVATAPITVLDGNAE